MATLGPFGQFNKRFKANLSAPVHPVYAQGYPKPPTGTYDPSIDASERAAQRGYGDLQADTTTQNARAASDYATQLQDIGRTRDNGLADILTARTRAGQDLNAQGGVIAQNYARAGEDYKTQINDLHHTYSILADNQAQSANSMGDYSGGALLQAMQKRQANETAQASPLNTAYARAGIDKNNAIAQLLQSGQRQSEDLNTQQGRLTTQYGTGGSDYGLAGLTDSLSYQRGSQDRATALQRAGRELTAYQNDLIPTRYYSAAGLKAYTPPKPKGKR